MSRTLEAVEFQWESPDSTGAMEQATKPSEASGPGAGQSWNWLSD
jgi:hypothetical protein